VTPRHPLTQSTYNEHQRAHHSLLLATITIPQTPADTLPSTQSLVHHGSNHPRSPQTRPARRPPNTKVLRLVLAHRALATASRSQVNQKLAGHRRCRDHRKRHHGNQHCAPTTEERCWQRGKPGFCQPDCRDARSTRGVLGSDW
jgi:hypothetical protein